LPEGHREIANELRAKYRLAKDRMSRADIAAVLVLEADHADSVEDNDDAVLAREPRCEALGEGALKTMQCVAKRRDGPWR